jgi:gp16 family phage-associated protein
MDINSTEERRAHVEKKLSFMGLSLRGWAIRNGFHPSVVKSVVEGNVSCRFGQSHKIAVLLGLKEGEILEKEISNHGKSFGSAAE